LIRALQVWLPGDEMEEGETLQYDPSVYDCMSSMSLDWPCLSFDVLRDHLGAPRSAFPHTLFMVAGTQVRLGCAQRLSGGIGRAVGSKLLFMGGGESVTPRSAGAPCHPRRQAPRSKTTWRS
jgi:hypothetical protein